MQEVSFEEALEVLTIKDPRYPREAYLFVREALDHTQRTLAKDREGNIRHVSGQELLAGIKDFASSQFGPMAMMVLEQWGIHSCQDFGELVFNMVETGGCPTLSVDDITDLQSLAARLQKRSDPLSSFVWESLSEAARTKLGDDPLAPESREILTKELNGLIRSGSLYQEDRFAGVELSSDAKSLLSHPLRGVPLAQFNRILLESAYPKEIAKSHGLLAKTKNDTRADFEDGYDFYDAFRKPFLPPSKQVKAPAAPAASHPSESRL
jgi:uncharacterized repeat protein (TIGR04138 family)